MICNTDLQRSSSSQGFLSFSQRTCLVTSVTLLSAKIWFRCTNIRLALFQKGLSIFKRVVDLDLLDLFSYSSFTLLGKDEWHWFTGLYFFLQASLLFGQGFDFNVQRNFVKRSIFVLKRCSIFERWFDFHLHELFFLHWSWWSVLLTSKKLFIFKRVLTLIYLNLFF